MTQISQGSGGGPHKRAKNMEMWLRDRDEDLALFHDMRTRERNNFLHPSNDDIESSLSTELGIMSCYRFSVATPTHRAAFNLLAGDAEKNDYDWLLTPPGTPLFPSLDQEIPVVTSSKRSLNQSASAVKTFRVSHLQEPMPKVLRASPSPRRTSTASSPSSTSSMTRGRASSPSVRSSSPNLRPSAPSARSSPSVRDSSPNSRPSAPSARSSPSVRSSSPNLRPSTPSARSSTPTGRASGGVGRSTSSITPTLRRTNTAPTIRSSSAGISGARNRGSSLSPKFQARHAVYLPDLSSEPPPNLRTSIADSSSSFLRGRSSGLSQGVTIGHRKFSSDASETSRSSWQLTSSTVSRSANSSHSQDQCSSQTSKGSIVSSYDDGVEICRQTVVDASMEDIECTSMGPKRAMKMGDEQGCKYSLAGKRQTRVTASRVTSCGASTKKYFEVPMRQMEHHRSSQTMFRPLLSSAPTSSFYSTIPNIAQKTAANPVLECSTTIGSNANLGGGTVVHSHKINANEKAKDCDCEKSNFLRNPARKVVLDEGQMATLDGVASGQELRPCRSETAAGAQNEIDLTEWVQLENFDGQIQNDSRVKVYEDKISEAKYELLVDGFTQRSADEGVTGAGFPRDSLFSECREKNSDYLFVTEEKSPEVLATKLVPDKEEMELADWVGHGVNLHPCRMKCVDGCENESQMKLSEEWVQLESFDGRILHDFNSEIQEEKSCQIKQEHLMDDGLAYVSARDDITHFDSYIDSDTLQCRKEDIDHLFVDIQEDLSFQSHSSNLQESVSEKCCNSVGYVESAGTEASQDSRVLMLACTKQDILKQEVGTVPESGMEPLHELQGMMCFQVSEYALSMDQSDSWGDQPGNCLGQESPKTVSSCDKSQQGSTFSRSFTLEEATDTILFCSSIVHDIVYRAATAAIEKEHNSATSTIDKEVNSVPTQRQTGEAVMLAGMFETGYRNSVQATWKRPPVGVGSTVRRTLTYVQKKQRLIFQHSPLVTHQQYLMDQTGTAIIENAEAFTQMMVKVPQKEHLKVRKVKSRCRCTVM